jgi:disulfide bond formation protein DsbB
MQTYGGGVDVQNNVFLKSARGEMSGQLHAPAAYHRGSSPTTHWIGSWVCPRADLNGVRLIGVAATVWACTWNMSFLILAGLLDISRMVTVFFSQYFRVNDGIEA